MTKHTITSAITTRSRKLFLLLTVIVVSLQSSFAYDPPGPGGDPTGNPNNEPLGGGAPLDEGYLFLLLAGMIYLGWKVYRNSQPSFSLIKNSIRSLFHNV